MKVRDEMRNNNENLGWCRSYVGSRVAFSLCEGRIASLQIDGKDVVPEEKTTPWAPKYSRGQIMQAASIATDGQADPDDPDPLEALLSGDVKECPCCECPWVGTCDALDIGLGK